MNECVRKVLDEQIASEDVGLVFNSIPFSVQVNPLERKLKLEFDCFRSVISNGQ
jgi:hypothetical protein